MTLNPYLTMAYAGGIYCCGNRRFSNIKQEYVQDVKKYAGEHYSYEIIDNALDQEWITLTEYNETIAFKVAYENGQNQSVN